MQVEFEDTEEGFLIKNQKTGKELGLHLTKIVYVKSITELDKLYLQFDCDNLEIKGTGQLVIDKVEIKDKEASNLILARLLGSNDPYDLPTDILLSD